MVVDATGFNLLWASRYYTQRTVMSLSALKVTIRADFGDMRLTYLSYRDNRGAVAAQNYRVGYLDKTIAEWVPEYNKNRSRDNERFDQSLKIIFDKY